MEFEDDDDESHDEEYALSDLLEGATNSATCEEELDDNDEDLLPIERPRSLPSGEVLETANICLACIEVIFDNGRFRKVFGFCPKGCDKMMLRTVADVKKCVDLESATAVVDGECSPRISAAERTRRILGFALGCNSSLTLPVRQFISATNEYDRNFLAQPASRTKRSSRTKSVCIARMISEYHWREEIMTLSGRLLVFHHPDKEEAYFTIHLSSLLGVRPVDARSNDMVGFCAAELETLGRIVRLLFASTGDREYWAKKLRENISDDTGELLENIADPSNHFLHKSTLWSREHRRRVLNCRRLAFPRSVQMSTFEASALVEDSILLGYEVQQQQSEDILVQFLDSVAKLKMVDVYQFSEQDLLTFFLNVFHLMMIHSNALLGPPGSQEDFVERMHTICYQVSDDVFSLAELEHSILKSSLPFPTTYHPGYCLPKSTYPFAIKSLDFRVLFALNVGSSTLDDDEHSGDADTFPTVPIYNSEILDTQLDATAIAFLDAVRIERKLGTPQFLITLPQVCKWYANELGGSNVLRLVDRLSEFLSQHNRVFINSFQELEEPSERVGVKYIPYSYTFRDLRVEDSRVRKRLTSLDPSSLSNSRQDGSISHRLDSSGRSRRSLLSSGKSAILRYDESM